MVVKSEHTVVAIVAVRSSLGSEKVTALTPLELINMRVAPNTSIIHHIQIKNLGITHIFEIAAKFRINLLFRFFIKIIFR